eukprot:sb/3473363/
MEVDTPTLIAMQLIPVATILLGIIAVYVMTKMIARTEEGIAYEANETRRELKLMISLMEPLTAELGPMFRTILEKNKTLTHAIVDQNVNLASRQGGILHQLKMKHREVNINFEMIRNGAGPAISGINSANQTDPVPITHRAAQTDYVVLDIE